MVFMSVTLSFSVSPSQLLKFFFFCCSSSPEALMFTQLFSMALFCKDTAPIKALILQYSWKKVTRVQKFLLKRLIAVNQPAS